MKKLRFMASWVECQEGHISGLPATAKGTQMGFLLVFQDDAIAARNFRSSALSIAMKRNGCKPIGAAEQGLSSSAMASTGPRCVENSSSTTAPELSGLSTRSNPPVTEMVCSLADEHCPSPNRIVAEGMSGSRTRTGRRAQGNMGEVTMQGNNATESMSQARLPRHVYDPNMGNGPFVFAPSGATAVQPA
ncbi:MAG: hypothetical protein ABSF85_08700 [Terriglobales bacterium]|jgi:hypothetical protein